ncbi:MAG: hypothetical protein QOF02_1010 [Blastocatellia bacterium]|jgi:hypothetical protein|nr:hypothetical protein [Blastocatellia bacterium]
MTEEQKSEQAATLRLIREALDRHGEEALDGAAAEEVARLWIDAGFDDVEEVEGWLRARCFKADRAQALEAAGFTPEQAALRTKAGTADYEETIAYKLNHNDLSLNEARRIITSAFWDS